MHRWKCIDIEGFKRPFDTKRSHRSRYPIGVRSHRPIGNPDKKGDQGAQAGQNVYKKFGPTHMDIP